MRLQWLARSCIWVLATCSTCEAKGHGRLTAVTLLLAVALQIGIALVVPHPRSPSATVRLHRAVEHEPRRTALVMGHLVRVQLPGFSKPEP